MSETILVIDEGTTSTRAMLFERDGRCLATEQTELTQHYPRPGWVEHDAAEIWRKTLSAAGAMVAQAGGPANIAAIGVTNQRETIVFWDRVSGEPLAPAIVWQDRRTADDCRDLREAGHEDAVQAKTGLLLDPYFSGSKIGWAMREWPQLRTAGDRLAIGTVESWLVWKLTGAHVTDASNAGRTALMTLAGGWDEGLCELFGVPRTALPEIVDCAGRFGETRQFGDAIPISGLAGDQQAAMIGQACLCVGDTKATFGTGAFVLTQCGAAPRASANRLLSTVAWQIAGERHYALEGSVFVAGSLVKWLRDSLGLIADARETDALARSVADNAGVYLVPALSGLGAPWWRPEARAAISGLTFASGKAHVVRAALEAMAHQAHDLKRAFAADGADWGALKVDGGMVANDWLAQDLADMLDLSVERPRFAETTALGAAMLAGVGVGLFRDLAEASAMRGEVEPFAAGDGDRGAPSALGRLAESGRCRPRLNGGSNSSAARARAVRDGRGAGIWPAPVGAVPALFTGVGPIEAALATGLALTALASELPDLVVSLGSGGIAALPARVGAAGVGGVVWRDMDATRLGFARGVTPVPRSARDRVAAHAPVAVDRGPGDRVHDRRRDDYEAIDADLIDMETYAVLRACQRFGVPLIGLRGVSDGPGELAGVEGWTALLEHLDDSLAAAVDELAEVLAEGWRAT